MSTEALSPSPIELTDTEPVQSPVPDATDRFEVTFSADDVDEPDVNDDPPAREKSKPEPADPDAFPGRAAFRIGKAHPAVTRLGRMLIKRGGKRFYSVGAGPVFGVADRNACAAFQRAQGWTDKNADGYPGPRTWELLLTGQGRNIPAAPAQGTIKSPVPGYSINYAFGVKNRNYAKGWHTGADYAAPKGTPIIAVVSGQVVRADNGGAYGTWTQIRGKDGHVWMYAHQSRRAVRHGQTVKAGQVIGYVGTTGNSTGPHLHLEKSKGRQWRYGDVVKPTW